LNKIKYSHSPQTLPVIR